MLLSCDANTESDYVEFSNFNIGLPDRQMVRYCGTTDNLPRRTISSGSSFFRVTFHSNNVYDATGFEAFYEFRQVDGRTDLFNTVFNFSCFVLHVGSGSGLRLLPNAYRRYLFCNSHVTRRVVMKILVSK